MCATWTALQRPGGATVTVTGADGRVTTVRPENENAACSDTGLVTFYAAETASLDYGPEPLR